MAGTSKVGVKVASMNGPLEVGRCVDGFDDVNVGVEVKVAVGKGMVGTSVSVGGRGVNVGGSGS